MLNKLLTAAENIKHSKQYRDAYRLGYIDGAITAIIVWIVVAAYNHYIF